MVQDPSKGTKVAVEEYQEGKLSDRREVWQEMRLERRTGTAPFSSLSV